MKTHKLNLVKKALLIIMIGAFVMSTSNLQAGDDNKIVIGEKVKLQSKVLDEERTMFVYLPKGYDLSSSGYPVMYLLDGGYHFHHASGIVQFLSSQGQMPPMIVVAVTNVDRGRDFTPTKIEKKANTGGADKFMSFLSDELFPYIEKNYRTETYNILTGHSLGGTFATYAFLTKPEMFDAYIAISPYLAYDENLLVTKAEAQINSSYKTGTQFYMTLGDEPKYVESIEKFTQIVESNSPEGLEFSYIQMKDENHGSIPHLSIYNGLESIYSDWQLPKDKYKEGLASIDHHYKFLSDKYGYKIETPEYAINGLGYFYLQKEEDTDKAIEVFKENVKRFPASANVYDSLGEAYENSGQNEKAEKNYQKAVEIAEKEDHPYLKVFTDNLNRVQENLAER
jgi:predicted alpha/beta superfamily hydrolase